MSKALLIMDVQEAVVARYPDPGYLPRLAGVIARARAAGTTVIYVTVGFRDGAPEVSANNKMFGRLVGAPGRPNPIHSGVAPAEGDIVVVKRRVSAFAGSDLDVVLRARGVREMVLTGISTSGVVLSTLREAADRDFDLTVLADGCLDNDPEVHRVLVGKVFPMQATVVSSDDFTG
ncbi:cysteine hydrolase [Actinoplanes bogorensis]|uniref:Cysteine hydrolase n=1 Tax=Paractinoplanes bogorensis TaxID=1610840 RepID=A0ABS5YMZ7_9ACTN|nr:isochorismatase family cysteine hydrolase [Actinoplanes bogorensis]MBU2664840.1 cysteine hydrolase [Actinoplanes bogorensis]